ncbi:MAG TPA: hypothetical protein V6D18_18300 [Thermosynechococcaceae cyanobacterium]
MTLLTAAYVLLFRMTFVQAIATTKLNQYFFFVDCDFDLRPPRIAQLPVRFDFGFSDVHWRPHRWASFASAKSPMIAAHLPQCGCHPCGDDTVESIFPELANPQSGLAACGLSEQNHHFNLSFEQLRLSASMSEAGSSESISKSLTRAALGRDYD